MAKLPDFEALAIFAKVVELRSFAAASTELALSKATVSKAVSRLEERLGARLFNRTSRRLALTDAGQKLAERAARLLSDGEAAENEALAQSATPRGLVRLAVPMTFGVKTVAPLLPEFLAAYPEVSIDLHLSDATVDLIGEGFDAGLRIARLPDSSLIARRLCAMPRYTVAAPSYLKRHGRPTHPMHLAEHKCFGYAYLSTQNVWHYTNASGEQASVRPGCQLRVNNGEAVMPALLAGLGHRRPAGLHRRRRHPLRRGGSDPERLEAARRRRASRHPARRPAPRPRRGAGGIFDEAVCQGEEAGRLASNRQGLGLIRERNPRNSSMRTSLEDDGCRASTGHACAGITTSLRLRRRPLRDAVEPRCDVRVARGRAAGRPCRRNRASHRDGCRPS